MKTLMDSFEDYDNLFDAANPLSLTLCRGAGKCDLNFDDPNVVLEWENRFICQGHKDELLDKWHHLTYNHILKRSNSGVRRQVCSVSGVLGFNHDSGKAPLIRNRNVFTLNQNEADAILKNNHVLLHPGIPLCPEHKKYVKDALSQRTAKERGYMLSPPPEENGLMSDSDDVDDESNHRGVMQYEDPDFEIRLTSSQKERYIVPSHIQTAFYKFAHAAEQNRVMSQILAPESPEELKNMALGEDSKNMWHVSSDHELSRVLEYASELYLKAESRTERLHLISMFSPFLSMSHLQQYVPGLSKVMYYQSKKLSRREMVQVTHTRESYVPIKVHYYVEFITSNAVTSSHTFDVKKTTLSDGSIIELPNTIRKQGATEIIAMYKTYLMENDLEEYKMSDSTYYRILSACPATKQSAAVCVDYFMADMLEAQEKIREILNGWHEEKKIPTAYRNQLIRGIEESVNYFRTDYRIHLSGSSNTADHCMQHSLSDPVKPEFQIQCDHDHSVKCDRCEMAKNVEGELLDYAESLVKDSDEDEKTAIERYREHYAVIKECLKKMLEFKRHVLRSKYTDNHRSDIVEKLEDDEALITLDFAQKLLPQKFHETQLDYFGKRGMSYHIAHVIANVSDSLVTHAFVHILKDGLQDNQIVTALLTHILSQLGGLGVRSVSLRSDNAGCYHSAKTIFSLNTIAEKTGVIIRRYSFSEPQNGKGSCDRVASQIKRQVREHVDRGNDVTTPEEFFEALKVRPLKGLSFYLADLIDREISKKNPVTINGMSGLYDFTLDDTFLIARRYTGIGDGVKLKVESKYANTATLEIIDEGGHTADKTNTMNEKLSILRAPRFLPLFWRMRYMTIRHSIFTYSVHKENVVKKDELHHEVEEITPHHIFRCPVAGCSARFLYFGSLEHHLDRGKHNSAPERKTLRDEALHTYRLHLEDLMAPVTTRVEVITNALKKLRRHKNDQLQNLPIGWALRTRAKQGRFSDAVHNWLKKIFEEGITGRKKNGKEVEQMMKTAVNDEGNMMFSVDERLNWRQIQSVFSQLTRKLSDGSSSTRSKRNADHSIVDPGEYENEYSFQFENLYLEDSAPTLADIIWQEIREDSTIFLIEDKDSSRRRSHSSDDSSPSKRRKDELLKK